MTALAIPSDVLAQLYAHARAAFPAECCGYLVGPRGADRVDAAIACTNAHAAVAPTAERSAETAFAIAGRELFDLVRSFDGPRPARIIYHSHPNGRAYFSPLDDAFATAGTAPAYPVQHLVIGVVASGVVEVAQLGWSQAAGRYVELARWSPS